MTDTANCDALGPALTQAREHIQHTRDELARLVRDPHAAHAAVAGAYHLTDTLAGLVRTLIQLIPAVVPADPVSADAASEVAADLRAMHGCLTTAVLLAEPALTDLRGLSRPNPTSSVEGHATVRAAAEVDRTGTPFVTDRAHHDVPTQNPNANGADRAESRSPLFPDDPFPV